MKKFLSIVSTCLCLLCLTGQSLAATRAELAAIKVSRAGDFKYWTDKSPVKQALVDYVQHVTNKKDPAFIPIQDRIAVFDVDGTLLCETAPGYFDEEMFNSRVFKDHSWQPSADLLANIKLYKQGSKSGLSAAALDDVYGNCQAQAFAGMTLPAYQQYIRTFMQEPAQGLSNLQHGEAFYLPMVETVSYLKANDFNIYLVSGCDRMALRVLADGILPVSPGHIIGTDTNFVASHQNGEAGSVYQYRKDDTLVRGNYLVTDTKMNKVSAIVKEIGQQPVLAFGNSSGDYSMFRYTLQNNKHKAAAFVLLCDDVERELGNLPKAAVVAKSAQENGWIAVSMQKDFKTIYGDNVKRTTK